MLATQILRGKPAADLQLRRSLITFPPVNQPPGSPPPPRTCSPPGRAPATFDVATLLGGQQEVRLLHRGQEYRLRVTRQGKLILTK